MNDVVISVSNALSQFGTKKNCLLKVPIVLNLCPLAFLLIMFLSVLTMADDTHKRQQREKKET